MGVCVFSSPTLTGSGENAICFLLALCYYHKVELISTLCIFSLCSNKQILTICRDISCKE